jgi:hypothetical protein
MMNLTATPTITAFDRSPDGGNRLARDMRVRWALEGVGQSYAVRLVSFRAVKEPAHRALHPLGQIPTYEDGDLTLFESRRSRPRSTQRRRRSPVVMRNATAGRLSSVSSWRALIPRNTRDDGAFAEPNCCLRNARAPSL